MAKKKMPKLKLVDPEELTKKQLVIFATEIQNLFLLNEDKTVNLYATGWFPEKDLGGEVVEELKNAGLAAVKIGRKTMDFDDADEYLEELEREGK